MKDISYCLRHLYVNETGIGEEIKERIEQLKIADQLTGEDFNWDEFSQYSNNDNADDEQFEIDI